MDPGMFASLTKESSHTSLRRWIMGIGRMAFAVDDVARLDRARQELDAQLTTLNGHLQPSVDGLAFGDDPAERHDTICQFWTASRDDLLHFAQIVYDGKVRILCFSIGLPNIVATIGKAVFRLDKYVAGECGLPAVEYPADL
jgi:hypothetical protein